MEVGGEVALAEGNRAGGEADGGGRRRGTRREEMPADVALSVHIIGQHVPRQMKTTKIRSRC